MFRIMRIKSPYLSEEIIKEKRPDTSAVIRFTKIMVYYVFKIQSENKFA
jgi:hypothetical protein